MHACFSVLQSDGRPAAPPLLPCIRVPYHEQGADWLYTAKNAEKEIDRILGEYYEGQHARGKSPRRPGSDPRAVLDRVGLVIDARKRHLRRQEDDLKGLISAIQKWDDQSKSSTTPPPRQQSSTSADWCGGREKNGTS